MRSSMPSSPDRQRSRASIGLVAIVALVALAAGALLGACAGAAGKVTVDGAWARAAAAGGNSAAYMAITNTGGDADALTAVTAAAVTDTAQIHETSKDASGMTAMHPVERIPVAAATTVTLEPGGYHVMLMNLTQPLVAGSTVKLELAFERAGRIVVEATIR
jgi:copper(I)-binding protein